MKDARGHGSNGSGAAHQVGVRRATGRFKVQSLALKNVGQPWATVKAYGNRAVAERVAQHMRTDGGYTRVKS